jgi:hypothetical protein
MDTIQNFKDGGLSSSDNLVTISSPVSIFSCAVQFWVDLTARNRLRLGKIDCASIQ